MSKEQQDLSLPLLEIARDLTASLGAEDRYKRLLSAVRRIIPCDAACLLRLEGEALVPLAAHGLTSEALGRRFERGEHPRLDAILRSTGPVRFPADSALPDPFDGYVEADPQALHHIHACLGCALTDGGEVVGALTADALEPHAFDRLDDRVVATLGALAGAAVRTTNLIDALERTAEKRGRVSRDLLRSVTQTRGGEILGTSAAVRRLREEVAVVGGSDLAVLVMGETGSGKELVVRRIHEMSPRREEALIHVNCAALPESIAESELFGHLAGSFTGATRDRAGKFEVADGGTLFLDEVGELPAALQPKLLRALQEGEIQRVGSDRPVRVSVRILAATNRDLEHEVAAGRFRADLYHRLAVYPIHVPPLRDRREDIPLLAAEFLDLCRRRLGIGPLRLTERARAALVAADWPGNVRELKNVINRGAIRAAAGRTERRSAVLVDAGHLGIEAPGGSPRVAGSVRAGQLDVAGSGSDARSDEPPEPGPSERLAGSPGSASTSRAKDRAGPALGGGSEASPGSAESGASSLPEAAGLAEQVREFQRRQIEAALERHGGSWAAVARELGLHRANLHRLARRLGLR